MKCDIFAKTNPTFIHISWDTINKKYALGLRVYDGMANKSIETIYFDFETSSLLYNRLPEALSILDKFNNYDIKPLPNYEAVYHLSQTVLQPQDRKNWGASEFYLFDL